MNSFHVEIKNNSATIVSVTESFWRYHPDLNRGIEVLQTSALPLGYGTVLFKMAGGPIAPGQAVERNTRFELATFTLAR